MPANLTVISEDQPKPLLSPVRAALAEAISAQRAATASLQEAAVPVQRLRAVAAELRGVDEQIEEIDRQTAAAVGEWLAAGSAGERPSGPAKAVGLRQRRSELAVDAAAAELALPAAEYRVRAANEALTSAVTRRDEAIAATAAEHAGELIARDLIPALRLFLSLQARIEGTREALFAMGKRDHFRCPAAAVAAERIGSRLKAAIAETNAARDDGAGRRFLDSLAADASAVML